jgi:Lon protease-like protein
MSVNQAEPSGPAVPEDVLILLPVRNLVVFPGVVLPVSIGREKTVAAAEEAVKSGRKVGFLLQRDPTVDDPGEADLHRVGTVAAIHRYVTTPDGSRHVVVQGEQRFRVIDFQPGFPFLVARVEALPEAARGSVEVEARSLNLKRLAAEAIELLPQAPAELGAAVRAIESPGTLADTIASFLDIKPAEKQQVLETADLVPRLDRVAELLGHRIEVLRLQQQLQQQTREAIDERQREMLLREQMAQIRKELGEDGEGGEELEELRQKLESAGLPEDMLKQAMKELRRLERMPEAGVENSMLRNWLDLVVELPWATARCRAARPRARARRARGRPLRPRPHQEAHPRVPRGAQAQPRGPQPHPLLRRPAGRRQDLARAEHRARAGAEVPAREPRRRARRGRDPRPPAHLRRRAAGQHPAGHPQGRHAQPGDHARRDRQARPRHPGRPVGGAARGARPRAELDLPRQLPRCALRPVEGDVHHHRQHARHRARAAAGPHGGDRADRLHRGGKARDREALPDRAADEGERPHAGAGHAHRRGARRARARLHARGRLPQPRARDRRGAAPRGGAHRRRRGDIRRDRRARPAVHPRRAQVRERGRAAHLPAGRGHRASPGRRSAATCCSSRRRACRAAAS